MAKIGGTNYRIWENICGGKLLRFCLSVNLFQQIMALSISNISLQKCYITNVLPRAAIFHSKHENFPCECFPIYGMLVFTWAVTFLECTGTLGNSTFLGCATHYHSSQLTDMLVIILCNYIATYL